MAHDVEMWHPDLDRSVRVTARRVPLLERSGWIVMQEDSASVEVEQQSQQQAGVNEEEPDGS